MPGPIPTQHNWNPSADAALPTRSAWAGVLIGVGIAAFLDETVFHQLLHWHHFYDRSTPAIGLVPDGLFHALGADSAWSSVWSWWRTYAAGQAS